MIDDETKKGIEYLRGIFESGKVLRLGEPQPFGQFDYWNYFVVTAYAKEWDFAISRDELSDLPGTRSYHKPANELARGLEQRFRNVSPNAFVTATGRLILLDAEWPIEAWSGRAASCLRVRVTDTFTKEFAYCFVSITHQQFTFELKENPFQIHAAIANSIRLAVDEGALTFYPSVNEHPVELQQVPLRFRTYITRDTDPSQFLKQKVFAFGFKSGGKDTQVWIADPWDADYLGVETRLLQQEVEILEAENAARLRAMVDLAQSEPGVHVRITDFDRNPELFNVQNGTIDLRTGALRPYCRTDLLSKIAPLNYDATARCPRWEHFLDEISDGNKDLVSYLRRATGYSLTGLTGEQAFFLLYGIGANGKSTFLETIRYVCGDYAQAAAFETFLSSDRSGPRNDLAKLKGARFVTATESDEGKRLAESFVKQVTGGDTVTARFLYGENFDFRPQFKLWLGTNHQPVVRDASQGMWRRIRLIPFTVQIPDNKRDRDLAEKLKQEAPGILRWALEGLAEWREIGLEEPAVVLRATSEYQQDEDSLAGFFEEKCVFDTASKIPLKDLFKAYQCWAEAAGVTYPLAATQLSRALAERGQFEKKRVQGVIVWRGLRLRSPTGDLAVSDTFLLF